ncbi:MAG: putative glycolipid-binding domain-containing protein [Alphaproteobacteria bacterium]|nr:putative glycolipid-binding domain-containing protein [Alphaproteobacteria bacterium]
MTRIITARWRDWSGESLQHLVLTQGEEAIVAEAVVVGEEEGARFGARFRITCDTAWRTRRVEVDMAGMDRRLDLHGDGAGHWRDGAGESSPALDGAIDVDLPLTPFTNTLPIRRLNLGAGQSAELRIVYIVLPAFTVTISPQRYTCLEPLRRYRYESLDSDFVREVEVDSDGLVVTYPDLYRRVQ